MAIDIFNAFAVDTKQEEEGAYTQLPKCGDTEFLIARSGNQKFARLIQAMVKANKAVLDSKGPASNKKSDEILVSVMSKTILLGWKGEVAYKGKSYAYSTEAAAMLLEHSDFRAAVNTVAEDMETFKIVKDAEDEKN